MATDAQKDRKIEWERDGDRSETSFHGLTCQISPCPSGRIILIWRGTEIIHEEEINVSQRQAEIRAEVHLKNLTPKEVTRAFGRDFQKKGI